MGSGLSYSRRDFIGYDGLDQIIITAALVPPKADVFVDDIKYLLVLATPVNIVVLAMKFAGKDMEELTLHSSKKSRHCFISCF